MIQLENVCEMPRSLRAHCVRTARYAAALYGFAQRGDGLSHEELAVCSYLCDHPEAMQAHDIGKCFIPGELLEKAGKLTDEQMELVKLHTLWGALFFDPETSEKPRPCRYAKYLALLHHERWDGTGYPYGFRGRKTPFPVALFSIADVYDAITAGRPYQPARSHEEAWLNIVAEAGKQFSPIAVEVFKRGEAALEKIKKETEEL